MQKLNFVRINNSDDFNSFEIVLSLAEKHYKSKAVYPRGKVYIFGDHNGRDSCNWYSTDVIKEIEVCNLLTKTCKVVANIGNVND